ncbi:hypothetical protein GQ54DRAFT_312760 [Martensiomyces pterosporus]|nr:hypothetical protein GQ54DRAFT_312760 [Martensiomyces pterosporus]
MAQRRPRNSPYAHNYSYHGMQNVSTISEDVPTVFSESVVPNQSAVPAQQQQPQPQPQQPQTQQRPQLGNSISSDAQSIASGVSGTTINSSTAAPGQAGGTNPQRYPQYNNAFSEAGGGNSTMPRPPANSNGPNISAGNQGRLQRPPPYSQAAWNPNPQPPPQYMPFPGGDHAGPVPSSAGSAYGGYISYGAQQQQQQRPDSMEMPRPRPPPSQSYPQSSLRPASQPRPSAPATQQQQQPPPQQPPPYSNSRPHPPPPLYNNQSNHGGGSGHSESNSESDSGSYVTSSHVTAYTSRPPKEYSFLNSLKDSIKKIEYLELLPIVGAVGASMYHSYKHRKSDSHVPYKEPTWLNYLNSAMFIRMAFEFINQNRNGSGGGSARPSGSARPGSSSSNGGGGFPWAAILGAAMGANRPPPSGMANMFGHPGAYGQYQTPPYGPDTTTNVLNKIMGGLFKKVGGTRDLNQQGQGGATNDDDDDDLGEFDDSFAVQRHAAEHHYTLVYVNGMDLRLANAQTMGGAGAIKALRSEKEIQQQFRNSGIDMPLGMQPEHMVLGVAMSEVGGLLEQKAALGPMPPDETLESVAKIALATIIKIKIDEEAAAASATHHHQPQPAGVANDAYDYYPQQQQGQAQQGQEQQEQQEQRQQSRQRRGRSRHSRSGRHSSSTSHSSSQRSEPSAQRKSNTYSH